MGGYMACLFLRVVVLPDVADVLTDMATQHHGQRLDATTDAKDGQLPIVGQLGDKQLGQVALFIDGAQQRTGLFASIMGVIVGTTAEDKAVEVFQGVDDDTGIAQGRYDDGYTASAHD